MNLKRKARKENYRLSMYYLFKKIIELLWKNNNCIWVLVPDYNIPLAVPYSELNATVPLPDKRPFPKELYTVGNHIKHTRLSRNILIKDVIALLKIDRETLRGWELNLFEPHVSHYPLIISFLGYNPCIFETASLAGKIKEYRYKHGLTQMQFGKLLHTDGSVVWQWESNSRLPLLKTQKILHELFEKT
jgi:DNA-binding XRE family transcriptional regulator